MVIFITGISSGFGLKMAEQLVLDGHKVYGTVRREVEHVEGINYLKADVCDTESVRNAVNQVVAAEGHIDVFINNAGMGIGGPIEFSSEAEVQRQMDTNFMGLVRCVNAILPVMRNQGYGKIIALSSIGGLMGLPFQGFYSASKFAIEGYCEALRLEVKAFGIKVIVIRPGDFATGFTASRQKVENPKALETYKTYAESMGKIEHDENGGLKPIVLARKIRKIVKAKNPKSGYVIATFEQRLSVFLKRILPAKLFGIILGSYYKL